MPDDLSHEDDDPFSELEWDGCAWSGLIVLDSWSGFIPLTDLCDWITEDELPEGTYYISIHRPDTLADRTPPSREQRVTLGEFLASEDSYRDLVMDAIYRDYPRLRECYREVLDCIHMPPITTRDDLRQLIRLRGIHIMANAVDGLTRVGYSFACTWDEEHGLGVQTHAGSIVQIGGADEAFSEYFPQSVLDALREPTKPVEPTGTGRLLFHPPPNHGILLLG